MIKVFFINGLVVVVTVIIHYEFLIRLSSLMPKINIRHRLRIILGVCGALVAHAIEVWIFAFAYYFMHRSEGWGHLEGKTDGSLMDCAYFSFFHNVYHPGLWRHYPRW